MAMHRSLLLLMNKARLTSCFPVKIRESANWLLAVALYLPQRYESCINLLILTWEQVKFTECQSFVLKLGKTIPEKDSWSLSLIPRLSNIHVGLQFQASYRPKMTIFDDLGMRLIKCSSVSPTHKGDQRIITSSYTALFLGLQLYFSKEMPFLVSETCSTELLSPPSGSESNYKCRHACDATGPVIRLIAAVFPPSRSG